MLEIERPDTPPYSLQDRVMRDRFREIVAARGIRVIVETGVDKGLSTVVLAGMTGTVFAIDNNLLAINEATANLHAAGVKNAVLCCGNSPDVLAALMPSLPDETLFFLDAHWQQYWPLRDEIRALRRGKGVIVLHDMVVPGHPELGFDSYGGQPLDYGYVRDVLTDWSPRHRIEYNERAECVNHRGIGYIFPE